MVKMLEYVVTVLSEFFLEYFLFCFLLSIPKTSWLKCFEIRNYTLLSFRGTSCNVLSIFGKFNYQVETNVVEGGER